MSADRIATLLGIYETLAPPLEAELNPPASISDIQNAENELQVELPVELRELLLTANGQPYPGKIVSPFFPGYRFADSCWKGTASYGWLADLGEIVERVKRTREELDQLGDPLEEAFEITGPVYYHNRFIDFTFSENSDNLVLDLSSAAGGCFGQVVMLRTQPCQLAVLAPQMKETAVQFQLGQDSPHSLQTRHTGKAE